MKKAIVTGATSMIGINLINHLISNNIEVLAIERENSKRNNMLPKNDLVKVVQCNLNNLENFFFEDNNYDVMFHLAWDGTRGTSRDNVEKQWQNVKYSMEALKLAKRMGCKRFVGVGSQAEYGRVNGKISPSTSTNPENAYGIGKLAAGVFTNLLSKQIGIEQIWARIFSVYGPYDNNNSMVMESIIKMIENQESPEYTKAEQLWDYIYVGDAARALYLIAEKGVANSVYCIGSGKQRPLREYIELIKNSINPNIVLKIGFKEYNKNQVMNLCVDITELVQDTNFLPLVEFDDGIKKTIEWYKDNKKLYKE